MQAIISRASSADASSADGGACQVRLFGSSTRQSQTQTSQRVFT